MDPYTIVWLLFSKTMDLILYVDLTIAHKLQKMIRSLYEVPYFELTCAPKHAFLPSFVSGRKVILQFMCVGCWVGVSYLCYTVLTSPNKGETAVQ